MRRLMADAVQVQMKRTPETDGFRRSFSTHSLMLLVTRQGLEPRLTGPKPVVLPITPPGNALRLGRV